MSTPTRKTTDTASPKSEQPAVAPLAVGVHAAGDCPFAQGMKERLVELAASAQTTRYAADAADADLVLVVAPPMGDLTMRSVRRDPLYRRCRSKCVVLSEADQPPPLLPGLYAGSTSRWLTPGWALSVPYVQKLRPSELHLDGQDEPIEHLYSFAGSVYTHQLRERLMRLRDDQALLRDTGDRATADHLTFHASEEEKRERRQSYDLSIAQSAFVLCPRGVSPASVRFYETLRAGRVPVVISDDWVLPAGPDWDDFVLRIPEAEVESLPQRIREHEHEAAERGRLARKAWELWFADDVLFDRLVGWAQGVQSNRHDTALARCWRQRLLLSREHWRQTARWLLRKA